MDEKGDSIEAQNEVRAVAGVDWLNLIYRSSLSEESRRCEEKKRREKDIRENEKTLIASIVSKVHYMYICVWVYHL